MTQTPEATTTMTDTGPTGVGRASFPWAIWIGLAAGFTTALALVWAPSAFHPNTGWMGTIIGTWVFVALLTALPWAVVLGTVYRRHRWTAQRTTPAALASANQAQSSATGPVDSPPRSVVTAPRPVPPPRSTRGSTTPAPAPSTTGTSTTDAGPGLPTAQQPADKPRPPQPEADQSAPPPPSTVVRPTKPGTRRVTVTDAVNYQRGWTPADRQVARQVVAWAQGLDRDLYAYIPPSGEVAVLATSSGRRLVTFRQGHVRVHTATRPPLPGIRPGSQSRTWNLPLSRYRGV